MAVLTNPTDLARETLKVMAARRIAPTPENYSRCYYEIAGLAPPGAGGADQRVARAVREAANANPALAALARLARTLEENELGQFNAGLVALASGESDIRHDWGALLRELIRELGARQSGASLARRKEGLERVLIGFASDAQLFDKLQGLVRSWGEAAAPAGAAIDLNYEPPPGGIDSRPDDEPPSTVFVQAENVKQLKELLAQTLELGVADRLERFPELSEEAQRLARSARLARGIGAWSAYAIELRQFFFKLAVRGEADSELLDALLGLLGLLVNNIGELVDDDRWLAGQVAVMREVINQPLTTERIGEAERRFKEIVYKQGLLKHSLREAKSALKNLIALFVERLAQMTETTSDYHVRIEGYAGRLRDAEDIGALQVIVDELMSDTRSIQVDMMRYHEQIVDARRHAEDADVKVRELEAELEHVSEQVSQDQLTGALNRRGLDDAMQREMARASRRNTPLSVAVLDLDNFKRLNDTYGHQAGDDALVHLINVVRKTLRPTDIVARYGGEEFIILLSDTPPEMALQAMRRLQRELTKRFFLHKNERLLITFSAGVAAFKQGDTQEMVFGRADKAMYQAKLQGKNRVVAAEG